MSAMFTYVLFIAGLGIIIFGILYSVKYNKKIKDITVNPVSIVLSIFFFLALWLADLTTLQMSNSKEGIHSTNALIPAPASQVPSIAIWFVCIVAMFLIIYYYIKISKTKANTPYRKIDEFLARTQFAGLAGFSIFAAVMLFAGHDASFLGLYAVGIYHAMLPLIIIPQIVLALMIK